MLGLSRTEKLKKLVADSYGSSENPWISRFDTEKAIYDPAKGKGPLTDAIRDIYSRRGLRNEKRGRPIDGFEYLLKNLHSTQAQTILIHGVIDDHRREYYLFTNPEISELIGLLRFPVERSKKQFIHSHPA